MNKAILSIIALLVLFVAGGLILQSAYKISPAEEVAGASDSLNLPTPASQDAAASVLPSPTDNGTIDVMTGSDITELKIEDEKVGTGDTAVSGKTITVNYKGTLLDGTVFDSSYDRGEPFSFDLGAGDVIEGWDKGFDGMKVGGKRKLTIPASMGYGDRAVGPIPANSPLIFEVELLKVE